MSANTVSINTSPVIVVAAGGTGGHIYPGLAVANALRELGADVKFVGAKHGLESRIVPPAGFPLTTLPAAPLKKSPVAIVKFPFAMIAAIVLARKFLKREHVSGVVGMGGYASIPVVIAARLCGVPCIVHESGAIAGRANLLAARVCKRVAISFDVARKSFPADTEFRVTGMPLSGSLLTIDRLAARGDARKSLGLHSSSFVVFATGGSLGSTTINKAGVAVAERWRNNPKFEVLLKAGKNLSTAVRDDLATREPLANLHVVDYFENIDDAYAAADVVVTRAGAGTIAELETVGLPSVLVPYPFAPDDHQAVNASVLVDRDAAIMLRDPDANAANVGEFVEALHEDPIRYKAMSSAAHNDVHKNAASQVAKWVLELT